MQWSTEKSNLTPIGGKTTTNKNHTDSRQIVIVKKSNNKKWLYNNGEVFPSLDKARRVISILSMGEYPFSQYDFMTIPLISEYEKKTPTANDLRTKSKTWREHFKLVESVIGDNWLSDTTLDKKGQPIPTISQTNLVDGNMADVTLVWGILTQPYKDDFGKPQQAVFCAAIQTSGFIPFGCSPLVYLHEWNLSAVDEIPDFQKHAKGIK